MCALDSGKGAFCHLSFSLFTWIAQTHAAKLDECATTWNCKFSHLLLCRKVISSQSDYMTGGFLKTEKANLRTVLYNCIIKIKHWLRTAVIELFPEQPCPNLHFVAKSVWQNHFVTRSLVANLRVQLQVQACNMRFSERIKGVTIHYLTRNILCRLAIRFENI